MKIDNTMFLLILSFSVFACKTRSNKQNITLYNKVSPPLNYRQTGVLVDGKKNGLWVIVDSAGIVESEETYIDGKKFGLYRVYSDGFLVGETRDTIIKRDTITDYKKFNVNGVVIIKGQYVNGKPKGNWFYYTDNGKKLEKTVQFK